VKEKSAKLKINKKSQERHKAKEMKQDQKDKIRDNNQC
jgi:hypothetical protein